MTKRNFLLIIFSFFVFSIAKSQDVAPFWNGEKWGVINDKLEIISPCRFDSVGVFQNNYAKVYSEGKVGVLSSKGLIAVKPIFDGIIPVPPTLKDNYYSLFVTYKYNNGLPKYGLEHIDKGVVLDCNYSSFREIPGNSRAFNFYSKELIFFDFYDQRKVGIFIKESNKAILPQYMAIDVVKTIDFRDTALQNDKEKHFSSFYRCNKDSSFYPADLYDGEGVKILRYLSYGNNVKTIDIITSKIIQIGFNRNRYPTYYKHLFREETGDYDFLGLDSSYCILPYSDSLFIVKKAVENLKNNFRYGLISSSGAVIIPLIYDKIEKTNIKDVLLTTTNTGKTHLIKKNGNKILEPDYEFHSFIKRTNSFFALDNNGVFCLFEYIADTLKQLKSFGKLDVKKSLYLSNESIVTGLPSHVQITKNGYTGVFPLSNKYKSIPLKYKKIKYFYSNGTIALIKCLLEDSTYYHIYSSDLEPFYHDKLIRLKPHNYYYSKQSFESFFEWNNKHYSLFKTKKKYGVINTSDKIIINPIYDQIGFKYDSSFHKDKLSQQYLLGWKNTEVHVLGVDSLLLNVRYKVDFIRMHSNLDGYLTLILRLRNGKEMLAINGKVLPTEFNRIDKLENGLFKVEVQNKYGIIDEEGNTVVNTEYSLLDTINSLVRYSNLDSTYLMKYDGTIIFAYKNSNLVSVAYNDSDFYIVSPNIFVVYSLRNEAIIKQLTIDSALFKYYKCQAIISLKIDGLWGLWSQHIGGFIFPPKFENRIVFNTANDRKYSTSIVTIGNKSAILNDKDFSILVPLRNGTLNYSEGFYELRIDDQFIGYYDQKGNKYFFEKE